MKKRNKSLEIWGITGGQSVEIVDATYAAAGKGFDKEDAGVGGPSDLLQT